MSTYSDILRTGLITPSISLIILSRSSNEFSNLGQTHSALELWGHRVTYVGAGWPSFNSASILSYASSETTKKCCSFISSMIALTLALYSSMLSVKACTRNRVSSGQPFDSRPVRDSSTPTRGVTKISPCVKMSAGRTKQPKISNFRTYAIEFSILSAITNPPP